MTYAAFFSLPAACFARTLTINTGFFSSAGYLYQCPAGFAYWEVSKRCERIGRIPMCKRGMAYDNRYTEAALAPTEMYNVGAR